jgi:hypothetical protein
MKQQFAATFSIIIGCFSSFMPLNEGKTYHKRVGAIDRHLFSAKLFPVYS